MFGVILVILEIDDQLLSTTTSDISWEVVSAKCV
jgi:hypothetical protein